MERPALEQMPVGKNSFVWDTGDDDDPFLTQCLAVGCDIGVFAGQNQVLGRRHHFCTFWIGTKRSKSSRGEGYARGRFDIGCEYVSIL